MSQVGINQDGGFNGKDHIHRIGYVFNPVIPVGVLYHNFIYPGTGEGVLGNIDILLVEVR